MQNAAIRGSYAASPISRSTSASGRPVAVLAVSNRSRIRIPIAGSSGASRLRTAASWLGSCRDSSRATTSAAVRGGSVIRRG